MRSAFYTGTVVHARRHPAHAFEPRVRMYWLELDEIPMLVRDGLVSTRRFARRCFRRADHPGDAATPLDVAIRDLVEGRTGARPRGPIALLTQLRQLGVRFDPVSFFYCLSPSRDAIEAVVADVSNTPWGERHTYVLAPDAGAAAPGGAALDVSVRKTFHVSPFLGMDVAHRFRLSLPGETLDVAIDDVGSDGVRFAARLRLARRPFAEGRRGACAPLATLAGIYARALRIALLGAPFHPHPRRLAARPADAEEPVS
ncbi:MAG: DUF1365 family protein [Myxococcota bacterium]